MNRVTVFVSTVGAPTFGPCIAALRGQAAFEVVRNVRPHAAAQQAMVDRCRTEFLVKVDEDMLVSADGVRRLLLAMLEQSSDVAQLAAPLWDVEVGMPIYGIKIWRRELVATVSFEDHLLGDRNDAERLVAAGYRVAKIPRAIENCIGQHLPDPRPASAFSRWRRLWHRHRAGGHLQWIEPLGSQLAARAAITRRPRDLAAAYGFTVGSTEPAEDFGLVHDLSWLGGEPMEIAKGNLYKPLEMTLTLGGAVFPVTETDQLVLRWTDPNGDVTEVTPEIVDDGSTGELIHEFEAGQTDVEGYYQGQVTLTRDGKPISFPDDGTYFMWVVTPVI